MTAAGNHGNYNLWYKLLYKLWYNLWYVYNCMYIYIYGITNGITMVLHSLTSQKEHGVDSMRNDWSIVPSNLSTWLCQNSY